MTNHCRPGFARHLLVWVLAIAVLGIGAAGVLAGDKAPDINKLKKEYDKAYENGDFAKALEVAEQMVDVTFPEHIDALYKVAAMQCKNGKKDEAYEWLEFLFDSGYGMFHEMKADEDFALVKDDDRFKKMVRSTWSRRYLEMLERAERDEFQKPKEVMEALAIKPGEKVADIGAGSGYFTIPIAKAVGDEGIVWAIDIRKEMLDYIDTRLVEEELENVRLQLVDSDDPQLPQGKVDTILMIDTWHYIRNPEYAKKLAAGLAPGGRVIIIDYIPKPWAERPWGPPESQHTSREELDGHFAEAGLKVIESFDFLPEQYFVVYGAE
jgi:ubiquinone/menaquinone biosynthesis C-methylase UbiE